MKSIVDVYNTALGRLGGNQLERMNTPDEEGTVAALCRTFYPHVLDMALAHSEWAFARQAVALALKADESPNPDYPYRYKLPTDCIRPIKITTLGQGQGGASWGGDCDGYGGYGSHEQGFDYPYIIDGLDVLTTVSPAVLTYVRRVVDPVSWPPLFADAVAYGLAAELATAYVNDTRRQQMFEELMQRKLGEASAVELNSQNRKRKPSPWILSR